MSPDIEVDSKIIAEIDMLEQVVSQKKIETEADEADAARFIQMINERAKKLDGDRKLHTKPLNDKKRSIDKLFKEPLNRLGEMKNKLKKAIFDSVQARETRNREAMAAAQTAAQTGGNVTRHLDAIEDRPLPPSTTIRQRWEYVITDPSVIPSRLWSPDPKKIEAELARHTDFAHPPQIPGVRVTVGGSVTVRGPRKT